MGQRDAGKPQGDKQSYFHRIRARPGVKDHPFLTSEDSGKRFEEAASAAEIPPPPSSPAPNPQESSSPPIGIGTEDWMAYRAPAKPGPDVRVKIAPSALTPKLDVSC